MSDSLPLRGYFASMAEVEKAVAALRAAGLDDVEVYSPVLHHDSLEEKMPRKGSKVRWVTTAGGITGVFLGFLMCIAAAKLYDLITGGKAPVSLVPFVVVGFELTILFGALFTVGALIYFARLKPMAPPPAYDDRFSNDRYGVLVSAPPARREAAARALQEAGAVEVTEGAGD